METRSTAQPAHKFPTKETEEVIEYPLVVEKVVENGQSSATQKDQT